MNPFYNHFQNYIYVAPTADFIEGYQVYEYTQASTARTYGGEIYLHYHPHFAHRLHIEHDFSYVIGEDNNNNPLHLPCPLYLFQFFRLCLLMGRLSAD